MVQVLNKLKPKELQRHATPVQKRAATHLRRVVKDNSRVLKMVFSYLLLQCSLFIECYGKITIIFPILLMQLAKFCPS